MEVPQMARLEGRDLNDDLLLLGTAFLYFHIYAFVLSLQGLKLPAKKSVNT